ncbi:MAG: EcsC family protein [Oscillospiraceae bacterium]|nr:EcsC family protein [Oscillospiraceae bacterium]
MKREEIMNTLDILYDKVLQGMPPKREGAVAMAERYLKKNGSVDEAALDLITDHITKCTATGFVLGLGGLVTMPVTIPANIAGVLYFQLRMIAGVAYMGGYDVYSPQVRMLTYVCLAGISIQSMLKNTGVKIGTRLTKTVAAKLPAKLTATINRGVGYRLFTKFGSRGAVSVGKAVPIVGGIVSGSLDFVETRLIAERAYNMFIQGDMSNTAGFADYEILDDEET